MCNVAVPRTSRLGQLQIGDQILAINRVQTEGVTLQQAVKLVQEASDVVEMEVMFNVNDAIVPTSGTFEVTMQRTSTLTLGITINGWSLLSLSLSLCLLPPSSPIASKKLHMYIHCTYPGVVVCAALTYLIKYIHSQTPFPVFQYCMLKLKQRQGGEPGNETTYTISTMDTY